ncbi:hypothetical protein PFISCL1PPCAC_26589, partial [Pristionchus fissidentatus]
SQYYDSTTVMAKYRMRPIEPTCCCCKVSSFLKCTYVSIIVLSLCTLVWAAIAFFFHSTDSTTRIDQLLYQAYYDNQKPFLPMLVNGETNLKIFDLCASISGVCAGLAIFIALVKPNCCTLVASRISMLIPMTLITVQNMHFVSAAYGVPLTKENENMGLVVVMMFFSLFVINFFLFLNLFFSLILLCRLPTTPVFTRIR